MGLDVGAGFSLAEKLFLEHGTEVTVTVICNMVCQGYQMMNTSLFPEFVACPQGPFDRPTS
jgi:hypothetical protein